MKQQKLADNIGLKEKKPSVLRNNKAFSLIELMVTCVIGAIISMAISSVFIFTMEQFTVLVERNKAEESAQMSIYYLRNFLSQAVDVYAVDNVTDFFSPPVAVCGVNCPGAGQFDINFQMLLPGSWGAAGGGAGTFGRVAAFNRESARFNPNTNRMPALGSQMQTTGIFIKDQNDAGTDPEDLSGSLIFDYNSEGGPMIPTNSDLIFSRLHNIRVQRIPATAAECPNGYAVEVVRQLDGALFSCLPFGAWQPGGGIASNLNTTAATTYKVKTVTFEVVTRYFKSADRTEWNYSFPIRGIAAPFGSIAQTVKINLKDNVLTTNSLTGATGEERVHGKVYFYDYVLPSTRF